MRAKSPKLMKRIKAYIEQYALENGGNTPTNRDIGAALDISHVSVSRYLRAMNDLGMLEYNKGKISTELIEKIEVPDSLSESYADSIPAGPADDLTDLVDEYVAIPSAFKKGMRGKFFLLTISGNSMVDAGIENGDMVIVHRQETARVNDIVAALIDGHSSTLKRYLRDEKGPYLWAENESWDKEKRFYGRDFSVQGKAIKVVKDVN